MQYNDNLDSVTVVTITYNAEDFLEETILSVINQSYDHIEYIIIDGASTDTTVDIIKKYEDKIDYWVSEPDEGIYYAMNKAIEKATGKWINFMNAGDTFADNETVKYVMKHKEYNSELIYGDFIRRNTRRVVKAQKRTNWYSTMPFCHQTLFTSVNIMKKAMFDTRYKLAADHDFVIRMIEQDKKFQYIEQNIAIYAEGGFSQSEPFLSCIESLYILQHSSASKEEIEASMWYQVLKRDMSVEKTAELAEKTAELAEKTKKLKLLKKSISDLSSIKFLYYPLKKYKVYKALLKNVQENI